MVEINAKNYNKRFPHIDKENRLNISVDMEIKSIKKVDEMEMSFTAEISIILKWKDPRLTFRNLKLTGLSTANL